jgi:hypothetical protein
MSLRSVYDPTFLTQVHQWIQETGEVFIVIRYAYMAGAKDYIFVPSFEQFEELIHSLPPLADVSVFKERKLPIRGIANNELLEVALKSITDGEWWFLLCRHGDKPSDFSSDGANSHQEMCRIFEEFHGEYIAIGLDPPFHENDNENMQSGIVPHQDGSVLAGAY